MSSSIEQPPLFSEHLLELRQRLFASVFFLLLGTIAGYLIHSHILELLIAPLNQPIFYSSPAGGFDFVIKLSLFFGFTVSVPVFIYHTLKFIEPVLPERSGSRMLLIVFGSVALLVLGVLFAYFVSLPAALHFLGLFASEGVEALIAADQYFSFVTRYLFGFGLLFQLPLVLLLINSVRRISTQQLMGYQKWVVLLSFVVAAVLTPTPDVLNQLLMALPIIGLYQLSLLLLWAINRRAVSSRRKD